MREKLNVDSWQALMFQDFLESELPDASSKLKQVERIMSPLLEFENVEYRVFDYDVYIVEVFYLDKLVRITNDLNPDEFIELTVDQFLDALGRGVS